MTASRVSRVLALAGLPRASAYRTFGRDRDGFLAIQSRGGGVAVHFTGRGERAREECDRAVEVLVAAGMTAVPRRNNGVGGTYSLDVS